ncbi:threonine synthase [Kangiella sp.]|uniref:threonine synthase n=1 Tax=Kangiella sp. TaxID=1920245 RepID=UPI003A8F6DFE
MPFINIKDSTDRVSFEQAVLKPLGNHQGLYMPEQIPALSPDCFSQSAFSNDSFQQIAFNVLRPFTSDSLNEAQLESLIQQAFNFPLKLHSLSDSQHILELFHGPTLAFKDFGARFLAECLSQFTHEPITIITATSGDTGAAVAHAFHADSFQNHALQNKAHINVVILYPKGKISIEQEQLFCTLGNNIHTVAVEADFDTCQSLVKQAFDDKEINQKHRLNSANSINIARLLAQVCYYAALPQLLKQPIDTIAVPCGNFGNITAGLLAQKMGVPIKHFIAATNANDTVPRFFEEGQWQPRPTVRTSSNAMDVASPNNFPRLLHLYKEHPEQMHREISAIAISESEVEQTMLKTHQAGYTIDPHTAVALRAIQKTNVTGQSVALSTAHPAKFAQSVESITGEAVELPDTIRNPLNKPNLSTTMDSNFKSLKDYLMNSIL